jgi:hypothetical protein
MAKPMTNGEFLSGLVGTVVLYKNRRGLCMRSRPKKTKKKPSKAQLVQRAKFSLISHFVYRFKTLFTFSFSAADPGMPGLNKAISFNIKNAIEGTYPRFIISYSNVMVSRGDLCQPEAMLAERLSDHSIRFRWNNNSGQRSAMADDLCVVIAWCPSLSSGLFYTGSRRDSGEYIMDVKSFIGQELHTWAAFIKAAKNEISDSVYTGRIRM